MYIALKPGYNPGKGVDEKVKDAIDKIIGKVARPRNVWLVPDMPKTRSGKIMRRVIAAVSNFMDVGDVTTLANPEVVETIRKMVQTEKAKRGEVPKDLPKEVLEEIKRFGAVE
jgi:acetyl-CoA synthetase